MSSAATSNSTPSTVQSALWQKTRENLPLILVLAVALVWSYWTALLSMADRWEHDAEYSHGYLVPAFCLWILWARRGMLDPQSLKPNWSLGLPLLVAAIVLRFIGARYYVEWIDFVSLIPCVVGIGLLMGGWHALRWFWPAAGFLIFMMPLPYFIETALRDPLRRLGTVVSTYVIQTLGFPAFAEGTVINVNGHPIGVVEACSGLRMLMIFFALSSGVALLSKRPYWERTVILFSAIPIALISNIARITATGILYGYDLSEHARLVFHDLAGWLMMPFGLLLLWAELGVLARLFVEEEVAPMSLGLQVPAQTLQAVKATATIPAIPGR